MTDPAILAVVVSIVGLFGQAANVYLNLKTSKAILESERRILDRVGTEHPTREIFDVRIRDLTRRIEYLEERNA